MNEPAKRTESQEFLKTDAGKTKSIAIEIPSISLPKGGGALKGIDEKFSVNSVNGTAAFSIPLPFSPARGATPSLNLSYNSGAGNGIFGLGWTINLASIKRKTDKGLPQYFDSVDSDTFLFSEAEDLVPEFKKRADGSFPLDTAGDYIVNERDSSDGLFTIRNYRPRLEGLFARIERWHAKSGGEQKWRVITRENVTSLFGWTADSRVADPQDASSIYEWFPEFVFDDKGNCCQYCYRKEDSLGFDQTMLHNRNRFSDDRLTYTNLYVDKIIYGNMTPFKKFGDVFPDESDYMFQTVFDYGTTDIENVPPDHINPWNFREDAFSDYKSGFEIRTTRLCKRVLMFHVFEELAVRPDKLDKKTLIRSVTFGYNFATEPDFTFLSNASTHAYIKKPDGSYSHKTLPVIEFEYQKHDWNKQVKQVDPDALIHAPVGLSDPQYLFTDLFNEGLSGILTEQANGWYYKHNLGNGQFENAKLVSPKPSFTGLAEHLQLADLDADGGKQLVCLDKEPKGYFELDDDNEWQSFRSFDGLPGINFEDTNTRFLDLNGDGKAEVVISEDNVFTWYSSEGRKGYAPAVRTSKPFDEEAGPYLVFSDPKQTIFLADMSGDGMTDIVRIRNSEVCYWPNLGYGKFGSKTSLDDSPVFDTPDAFNPMYIRLADIDGSGTTDIIYLGNNRFTCWKNLSGNRFHPVPFEIDSFPEIHSQCKVTVTDLLGTGVACIVWSSPLFKDADTPLKYIDLMNSMKPHIMVGYKNNLGKEISLTYRPSTQFYLEDKRAGNPWVTKLHFPVHCVSKTVVEDKILGHRFVSEYSYHHGYYDHPEREFRGFGMVEQTDAETFEHWAKSGATNVTEAALHQEPVVVKKWTHTGAYLQKDKILSQFANDYWYTKLQDDAALRIHHELPLSDAVLVAAPGLGPDISDHFTEQEWREALRVCKGMALRSENFAKDAHKFGNTDEARKKELIPFSVATNNCIIELLQPRGKNRHAVFAVKQCEAITYNYERQVQDPRITHTLNIKLDSYGNVLESAAVTYPRLKRDASLPFETQQDQNETIIVYVQNEYTNDVSGEDTLRLRLPSEVKTFELKAVSKTATFYAPEDFKDILSDARSDTALYHEMDKVPVAGKAQKRLIEHVRSTYYLDNLSGALPLHSIESLALPFQHYQLAYTPELVTDIFEARVDNDILNEGKFTHSEGDNNWWVRSGTMQFRNEPENQTDAQNRFYTPLSYTDPYGATTKVKYYGNYFMFIEETEDALGNKSRAEKFNFRTFSAARMTDSNGNVSETVSDELGITKAVAVMGKGNEADQLTGFKETTDDAESALIQSFFNAPDSARLTAIAKDLLGSASSRFVYDFTPYTMSGKPGVVATITREQHFSQLPDSPVQIAFEYSSGSGEVVMKKVQAEPGKAKQAIVEQDNVLTINEVDTAALAPKQLRWIGNGRTVKNNKGNAVKQYEPYFSTTWQYENFKELVETGVSPVMYYDAAGRLIKTEMPDGTFLKVEFDSWKKLIYDANDTVLDSSWYSARMALPANHPQRKAAEKAAKHYNTPSELHFDNSGRPVLQIENNGRDISDHQLLFKTRLKLDAEGNLRKIRDARALPENGDNGNVVMQYKYDMLGNLVYQNSMDSGQRWLLTNILGKPLRTWDERDHEFQYTYDKLHRPLESRVINKVGKLGDQFLNNIFEKIIYGEGISLDGQSDTDLNLRGQIYSQYDTGGCVQMPGYNFKGQPITTVRTLFRKYKEVANWTESNLLNDLENERFIFATETDGLGRITKQIAPDGSVITPFYNEAGLLDGESVLHPGSANATVYIKSIQYNERGHRAKIIYGNQVSTKFYYDPQTFRLNRLESKRLNGKLLQDLFYTFDAAGNATHIEDKAIPVDFFANAVIEPVSEFTYDALNKLIEATGRENNNAISYGNCDNWNDQPFMQSLNPGDPMTVRNYTQHYQYDQVGNITEMRHVADRGSWTRVYEYESDSNRLKSTRIGDIDDPVSYTRYHHHARHGFMEELPHLEKVSWNFKDELVMTATQRCTDDTIPITTYYQYDSSGQRIRKITENQAEDRSDPTKKEERIYVAGYELYKKHSGANAGLERVSLSLMDEGHRFVIVETRNEVNDLTEKQLTRYQLHDHLGSSALELDGSPDAKIISFEEYHPFGTTAYQMINKEIRSAAKRYRFTGMERDEETGLEYHSVRYYLPWLGRWLSADPLGIGDGVNLYCYSADNPLNKVDTNGMQSYQRYFNERMVDLILASGNQAVISRLLVNTGSGFRLNTAFSGGFNAGHTFSGDRTSSSQQLAIEFARTNQPDGTMERLNPGMSKPAVDVEIGNGVTIPVERFTASELELAGALPAGSGNLPARDGWTRTELDSHLASARTPHAPATAHAPSAAHAPGTTQAPAAPHTPAAAPHAPGNAHAPAPVHAPTATHAPTHLPGTPHVPGAPHVPKSIHGKGILFTIVVAGGVYLFTESAYAAAQSANPLAETTDALVEGKGVGSVAKGIALDVFFLTPTGAVVGVAWGLWSLNQAAMDASHFPVPPGWIDQMTREGRNPFCALCHDPRGPVKSQENSSRQILDLAPQIDERALRDFARARP